MKRPTFRELLEKGERQRQLGLTLHAHTPEQTTALYVGAHRPAPVLRIVAQSCHCGVPMRKCACGSWVCDAPGHAQHRCEVLP